MKRLAFLLTLLIPALLTSQPCLPDGITFTRQTQIDSFQINHPNCTGIEGYVEIIGYEYQISSLNGLIGISSIGGYMIISRTDLSNLNGLDSLTKISGFLGLTFNDSMISLNGLENLDTIKGTMVIGDWAYDGNLLLTNLSGLDNLSYIGGDLRMYRNQALTSLSGLEKLNTIGGRLVIGFDPTSWGDGGNPLLNDITSLENLSNLGGALRILYNDKLTSLSGLEGLDSIGGDLWIEGNDSLYSLDGLENISFIEDYLAISQNDELVSIAGIENIESNSILHLYIDGNNLLENCAVQSICNYLVSPNGEIYINNNATGCNSPAEVEEACLVSVGESRLSNSIIIHPNPFTTSTTIEYELTQPETVRITFYNQFGKQVDVIEVSHQKGLNRIEWTPENLADGIYYFRLEAGEQMAGGKIVLVK